MAICPFAVQKLIPPGANDPKIVARVGILHVDGGNSASLYNYFNGPSGGVESHFFIDDDGVIEQYRDTDYQADANYRANDFAISIETQGFATGEWSDECLDSLMRLMRWCSKVHPIAKHKVQNWDGSGWGYHVLFGSPGPWTPHAKACPGSMRIKQFDAIIVPWIDRGMPKSEYAGPAPTPNITAALKADTYEERQKALRRVIRHGSDEASAAAKSWLKALRAVQEAKEASKEARVDLKGLEIK